MGKNVRRTRAGRAAITAPRPMGHLAGADGVDEVRELIAGAVAALDQGSLAGAVVVLAEATAACRDLWLRHATTSD